MSFFKRIFGRATPSDSAPATSFNDHASKVFPWVKISSPPGTSFSFELTEGDAPICCPCLGGSDDPLC